MAVTDIQSEREDRVAERIALLNAHDEQFRHSPPDPGLVGLVSRTGLRLAPLLETLIDGYGDRPALGQRARELRHRCHHRAHHGAGTAEIRHHQLSAIVGTGARRGRRGAPPSQRPGRPRRLRRHHRLRQPALPDDRPGVRLPGPGVGSAAAQRRRRPAERRSSPRSSRRARRQRRIPRPGRRGRTG